MPEWWPAVAFGWPGPILATMLSVTGLVRRKAVWLVAASVVLLPFSFYLLANPRSRWGVLLPVLPLISARATSRGTPKIAWIAVLLLIGGVLWIGGVVISAKVQPRA